LGGVEGDYLVEVGDGGAGNEAQGLDGGGFEVEVADSWGGGILGLEVGYVVC
jgi:hypothetical protein